MFPPLRIEPFTFTAHLDCPFCSWSSEAVSRSYRAAEGSVVDGLLSHVAVEHSELPTLLAVDEGPARKVA